MNFYKYFKNLFCGNIKTISIHKAELKHIIENVGHDTDTSSLQSLHKHDIKIF